MVFKVIESKDKISGVIMAGGKSSRIGTDKGLLKFRGNFLSEYAIHLIDSLLAEVYISSNNRNYEQFNLPIIFDIYKNIGPMGGLHAVLKTISSEYVFIISCDMPFMTKEVVNILISNLGDNDVIIPIVENKLEPLCAIYSRRLFPEIEKRIKHGNYKMQDLILASRTKFVKFENNLVFRNINTKEDLEQIDQEMLDDNILK